MTLGDMAAFVCAKVRQQDATALTRCKDFIRQRYEMIWNDQLWKDSLFRHEFNFDMESILSFQVPFGNLYCRDVGIWQMPPTVDKVLALRRPEQGIAVNDPYRLYRETIDAFAEIGEAQAFHVLGPVVQDFSGALSAVESEGVQVSSAADDSGPIRIRYIDLQGEERILNGTLPAAGGYSNEFLPQVILSITKNATAADVTLNLDSETVLTIASTETAAKKHVRIRLMPMPEASVVLAALVKIKPQRLSDDSDEPAIRGADNCLMAFAQGDMLQRSRQYGKAQLVAQEAVGLLDQLKRIEVVQEAQTQQIIPEVSEPSGSIGWHRSKGFV